MIVLPIEFISYLIVNKINNHPFVIQSKYDFQESMKYNNESNKIGKDYVDLIPYFNEPEEFEDYISKSNINNSFYTSINAFKKENTENILIQGDSWAAIANTKEIYNSLKNIAIKRNFGLYNAGRIGYSVSPMNVQLHLLRNKLNINPSIIITIMDQTDLGDELYRRQTLNKNTLELANTYIDYEFKKKFFNILDSSNFYFFKLLVITKEFIINKYKKFNKDFYKTISHIISRIIYLKDDVPLVISPLVYGLEKDDKKIIQYKFNNYINNIFKNGDLKKLIIVTHPHKNHLVNDKTKFKEDIGLIIENTILNSPHKIKILHINFNKDFNNIYKNIAIDQIFMKEDYASHLTIQNYADYYYPYIFSKCCN